MCWVHLFAALAMAGADCLDRTEFRVHTTELRSQSAPAVAMFPEGDFVVAWQSERQAAPEYGLFAQMFDACGRKMGDEFQVHQEARAFQTRPAIAASAAGFVIAWESGGGTLGGYDIRAQTFDRQGNRIGDEFQASQGEPGLRGAPSVAIGGSGEAIVAWHFDPRDGKGARACARRFARDGIPLGDEFRLSGHPATSSMAAVAMGPRGWVAAWCQTARDASRQGIFAQRFDEGDRRLGGEFQVNRYAEGNQCAPAIGVAPDGRMVIVWDSEDQEALWTKHVFAQRFDEDGERLGEEFQVPDSSAGSQSWPSIAVSPAGEFVIAWFGYRAGFFSGVFVRRFDRDGVPLEPEFRVHLSEQGVTHARALAMSSPDRFACTWSTQGEDGSDVFARVVGFRSPVFQRGDANQDGGLTIADAPFILSFLFAQGECRQANSMDANDDGRINIADPVFLLTYAFCAGPAPNPPFPQRGIDPTPDVLECPPIEGFRIATDPLDP